MKNVHTFESFLNESQTSLFGSQAPYIERFKSIRDFRVGEELPTVAGTPSEFEGVDLRGDWKKDGWAYTSVRIYTDTVFKNSKEVISLIEKQVIGPNSKEWTKIGVKPAYFKGDLQAAYQHPALGIIFFNVWNGKNDRSRNYDYQVQGYFMNGETSWGNIEKYPDAKAAVDSMMSNLKIDSKGIDYMIEYLKTRYNPLKF